MANPFNLGVYRWLNTVTGKSYVGSSSTKTEFEQALAEYRQNPTRCEVCCNPVQLLSTQQSKRWVTKLYNRKHCSRACANKVKSFTTLLKKEKAASAVV